MTATEGTETTDFTAMTRPEIREHLTAAIGDDHLSDDDRDALTAEVEDMDDVTADEFWTIVEVVLEAPNADELPGIYDVDEAHSHLATATIQGHDIPEPVQLEIMGQVKGFVSAEGFWSYVEQATIAALSLSDEADDEGVCGCGERIEDCQDSHVEAKRYVPAPMISVHMTEAVVSAALTVIQQGTGVMYDQYRAALSAGNTAHADRIAMQLDDARRFQSQVRGILDERRGNTLD